MARGCGCCRELSRAVGGCPPLSLLSFPPLSPSSVSLLSLPPVSLPLSLLPSLNTTVAPPQASSRCPAAGLPSRQGELRFTLRHFSSLHSTSHHFTSLHLRSVSLHSTSLHSTSLPCTPLHFAPLHFTSLRFTSLHLTPLHFTSGGTSRPWRRAAPRWDASSSSRARRRSAWRAGSWAGLPGLDSTLLDLTRGQPVWT